MWGFGGRCYWGRRETRREGIVVVFAGMSSLDKHVNNYVQIYSSLGWNSFVCHSRILNLFFPQKAEALPLDFLNELIEELKMRPCPLVFASFSGGPRACMYKVLQIIERKSESLLNLDDCRLLRDCISGHIYDSPVDFTSDLGRRFIVLPSVLKMSHPPRLLSWMANGIGNGHDALFLNSLGAPYLILCSESDELSSYQVICNFAQRIQLGGDVKLVTMSGSPHVIFKIYPVACKAAVTELLGKAAAVYSQRIRRLEVEGMVHDEISESMYALRKAAANSNQNFRGLLFIQPSDHFGSVGYYDVRSLQDEHEEGLVHLPTVIPTINVLGILGQILFNVCVPENVQDWDMKSSASLSRRAPFNSIKCIWRSRL